MSHISKIELEVRDLSTLSQACFRLGLELIKNQKTFKWWGSGDGQCDHVIKVPGARYEIGVIKVDDRFELQCDYFDQNIGETIGENGGLLKQAYAVEKTRVEARRKGYMVIEKRTDSGIRLHMRMQ